MKTKQQAADEVRDELITSLVHLEVEVRLARLEGRDKEKTRYIIDRDSIQLRLNLLEAYMKEIGHWI